MGMLTNVLAKVIKIQFFFDFILAGLWCYYMETKNAEALDQMISLMANRHDQPVKLVSKDDMLAIVKEIGCNLQGSACWSSTTVDSGVVVPPAMTVPLQDGTAEVFICPEVMARDVDALLDVNKCDKTIGYSVIHALLMHEFWHRIQFGFLYAKGGSSLIKEVLRKESLYAYGDSPLERGAIAYGSSFGRQKQDLNELLC